MEMNKIFIWHDRRSKLSRVSTVRRIDTIARAVDAVQCDEEASVLNAMRSVPRAVATGLQFGDLDRRVVETRSLPLAVLTPLVIVDPVLLANPSGLIRVISWIIRIKKPETKIASRILVQFRVQTLVCFRIGSLKAEL